jgi:hypothetical protein
MAGFRAVDRIGYAIEHRADTWPDALDRSLTRTSYPNHCKGRVDRRGVFPSLRHGDSLND